MQRKFFWRALTLASLFLGLAFSSSGLSQVSAAITMKIDPVAGKFWLEGSDTGAPVDQGETDPGIHFYSTWWSIGANLPGSGGSGQGYQLFSPSSGFDHVYSRFDLLVDGFGNPFYVFGIQIISQVEVAPPLTGLTGSGIKYDIAGLLENTPEPENFLALLYDAAGNGGSAPLTTGSGFAPITFEIASSSNAVPEPSSVLMWSLAGGALGWWRLRRRSQPALLADVAV
ncbi:MAG: PEP-CTERM sorting domain-containing protein [Planctomycetota bacterium]